MGRLRIIAGDLGGRRIEVPSGARVRPTAERVREALFSIVGAAVRDARVLDAYSGSGALGFEALSRGARSVVFLESDRATLGVLRANAARLGVEDRSSFLLGPAAQSLRGGRGAGPFDLILADPPYAAGQAERFLPLAAERLAPGGRIVVERETGREPPDPRPFGLERFRTARYGGSSLDLYRLESAGAAP